jgi:hypothetical protein
MSEIQQVYVIGDRQFKNKAEATDFLRRPKVEAAMLAATGGNQGLTDWLVENQESVEMAFDTGTIKRVTKSEGNKLQKALDKLVEANPEGCAFLVENAADIASSFRWPSVKRMTDEEKALQAKNTLVAASEGNEELATWVIGNEEAVKLAYTAGKVKREVSPKAAAALELYRNKKKAEKEAKEAAAAS